MNKKLLAPASILIETIAGQLCAVFYEVGRGQGLTSKYKTHKAYTQAHIEKFIPKAVEYCLDMLHNPNVDGEQKRLIFEALKERVNDDSVLLPEIDMKTILPKQEVKPIIVNTDPKPKFDINKVPLLRG